MADPQQAAATTTTEMRRLHLQPVEVKTSSPRFPLSSSPTLLSPATAISTAHRRIAIAVDLSDESAYAVKWAIDNYIRPGDVVILLHVNSTSVLYGADWGSSPTAAPPSTIEYNNFAATKGGHVAQPLVEAKVPFKIHVVKDHDMKERLCLEIERLGLSAVIMGSRGSGVARKSGGKGKLGSVSDYCVQHCVCPVVVVRHNQVAEEAAQKAKAEEEEEEEEMQEFHDADDFCAQVKM